MKLLKPNKYTNIDISVIGMSYSILNILKENSYQKYDSLLERIVFEKGLSSKENFLLSLSFLFLLGKISYYPNQDVISLLN